MCVCLPTSLFVFSGVTSFVIYLGFGFVDFASEEEVEKACAIHYFSLDQKKVLRSTVCLIDCTGNCLFYCMKKAFVCLKYLLL